MTSGIATLLDLRRFLPPEQRPPWHVHLLQREMNGGRTSEADLAVLDEHPHMTALTISGLEQRSFESLVERFGARLTALHLWKCPRITDLTPLERLPGLTHLAMYWNQRATRLWNLAHTPALRGLYFTDFGKLNVLDDLATGSASLETLEFGNANFSRFVVRTLEPLGELAKLQALAFNAKTIEDGRVQPLARLQGLQALDIPSGQFTVEQLAWLRARLPASVVCETLNAVTELRQRLRRGAKTLDIMVNGKRMPFLSSVADAKRVAKHTVDFQALVAHFEAHPQAEPGGGAA